MEVNRVLGKIKEKYLKDKEFKKEFDKDKEKAIEKYFGEKFLKTLKLSVGSNVSKASVSLFLSAKEELDDKSLESIAGGKGDEPKTERVTVTKTELYQKNNFGLELNNTRTGGDVKIVDNTQIFKV